MPLAEHPALKLAPNGARLWRYMDLPKFMALLQRRALNMRNLEFMAQSDPFEGTLPASAREHRNWKTPDDAPPEIRDAIQRAAEKGHSREQQLEVRKHNAEWRLQNAAESRRSFFVNCWHLSEHQSAAMWELYSRRDAGIAIVSCIERVREALKELSCDVYGGM